MNDAKVTTEKCTQGRIQANFRVLSVEKKKIVALAMLDLR
jgi:hypothetical protein